MQSNASRKSTAEPTPFSQYCSASQRLLKLGIYMYVCVQLQHDCAGGRIDLILNCLGAVDIPAGGTPAWTHTWRGAALNSMAFNGKLSFYASFASYAHFSFGIFWFLLFIFLIRFPFAFNCLLSCVRVCVCVSFFIKLFVKKYWLRLRFFSFQHFVLLLFAI